MIDLKLIEMLDPTILKKFLAIRLKSFPELGEIEMNNK